MKNIKKQQNRNQKENKKRKNEKKEFVNIFLNKTTIKILKD